MSDLATMALSDERRRSLVQRGKWLSLTTLAYNCLEGLVALIAGVLAGSVSLVGFGADSVIEVSSSFAALWRLRADANPDHRERAERTTLRIVGLSFLCLAIYIAVDAARVLWTRERPERTVLGVLIAALSVVIMPLLARQKRTVATELGSRALRADATQTSLCAYLSAIVLGGLLLNAVLGWWWADPLAALAMVPIIAKEGVEGLRGDEACESCSAR